MTFDQKRPPKSQLESTLRFMGIPCNCVGYEYALTAVPYVAEHLPFMEVYRRTGADHNTTWAAVERGLRIAAEGSVERAGLDTMAGIYGNSLRPCGAPTVSHMLVTAARLWYGMLPNSRTRIL